MTGLTVASELHTPEEKTNKKGEMLAVPCKFELKVSIHQRRKSSNKRVQV